MSTRLVKSLRELFQVSKQSVKAKKGIKIKILTKILIRQGTYDIRIKDIVMYSNVELKVMVVNMFVKFQSSTANGLVKR